MNVRKAFLSSAFGFPILGLVVSLCSVGTAFAQAGRDDRGFIPPSHPVPPPAASAFGAFVASGNCRFEGDDLCRISPLYTVPAGRTAVIESASGVCVTVAGSATREFQLGFTGPQGAPAQLSLPPSPPTAAVGTSTGSVNISVSSTAQNLKSYASGGDSGTSVVFSGYASANQAASFPNCVFTVSGYLIPSGRRHW